MTEARCFDLNAAPFCVVPDRPADLVAVDMLLAFEALRPQQDKVGLTFAALTQGSVVDARKPLAVAGMSLARAVDSGVGAGLGNAYHNAQHFCEVMLGAHFLGLLNHLAPDAGLEVVVAALIHDFHHDGKGNGQIPFRLERIAVNASLPYLSAAGVPEMQQQLITALVLSTEVMNGLPFAQACHAHHERGFPLPEIHPAAPELVQLAEHPLLARQALILTEADVLPSIGLSIENALRLQEALATEWNVALGLEHKYQFITKAFPGFVVGTLFQPNAERLRQYLLQHMNS